MEIFKFIFNQCEVLGRGLGFGSVEGLIIYSSILMYGIIKFSEEVKR